jgi:uncharacterized membrane protein HdeD (DUF308 family)
MVQDTSPAASGVGRRIAQTADRAWWLPLSVGIVWFVIAWLVLRADYRSLATVGVLVGVVFVVAAFAESVLSGLAPGGWRLLHGLLAVIYVLGAVWSFVRPVNTFFALASMLGLLLFLQGALYIARSIALRDRSPYWGITLASGVLTVLLALWVSTSDRVWTLGARAGFILLWVGFLAIFRGTSDIALAFELRRLGKGVRTVDQEVRERLHLPVQQTGSPDDAPARARVDGPSAPRY